MATKKVTEEAEVAEVTAEATEVKEEVKAKATEVKEEVKAKAKAAKTYKFKSANKFLSVSALGVQFINGEATVTELAVARALVKIDGVELVEE